METTYRTSRGFRIFCTVFAVSCTLTVVMIPFAIGAWWLGYKSSLVVRDECLEVNWFGRRTIKWADFASLSWVKLFGPGGMITKALMKPMTYQLHAGAGGGTKGNPRIAVGVFENTDDIVRSICQHTGLQIVA